MLKLAFLIRSLNPGGAERQLITLVKGLDKHGFNISVVTFYKGGELKGEFEKVDGVELFQIGKKGRWDVVNFLKRFYRCVKDFDPDIICSFLVVPNLFSLGLKYALRKPKVIWALRASYMDLSRYDWLARVTYRCEQMLARFPDLIIANSLSGQRHAISRGFPIEKLKVIPNGIDTERFKPDHEASSCFRNAWGVKKDEFLVGLVGRLDPMKDHPTFLKAAAEFTERYDNVKFVCVGGGADPYQLELKALTKTLGLENVLIWAGNQKDMLAVYNALDIATLSSYGEGFPNVVGEAMACGVPCVVTDVGDCAEIVGDTGIVVPPRSPEALAEGWKKLLRLPETAREVLGKKARRRIIENFSVGRMIKRYEEIFRDIVTSKQ